MAFQSIVPKNNTQAPPGTGIKNIPTGEAGNKYEKQPNTPKIAPDAPSDATANELPKNIGIARDANDERTAAFKYMMVKFDTPSIPTKDTANDWKQSILMKKWAKL